MTPVVLVSGWGFTPRVLQPLAEALQPWPVVPTSATRLVQQAAANGTSPHDELAGLVRQQGQPVVLVAWSQGAMFALQALPACQGGIRHLHLLSPTLRFLQDGDYTAGLTPDELAGLRRAVVRRPAVALTLFARKAAAPNDAWLPDPLPSEWIENDPSALGAGLDLLRDTDLRAMDPCGVPATILHGKDDGIMPVNAARLVAARLPGSTLTRIPGLGHLTPLYAPQIQAGMIRDALRG